MGVMGKMGKMEKMKKYIRWLFLIAFLAFAAVMRNTRLMYRKPNMFIILWLLASFIVVIGVVYFRDDAIEADEKR